MEQECPRVATADEAEHAELRQRRAHLRAERSAPRSEKRRKPRPLTWPKTGSTVIFRWA